ncbi:hypothetical protein [Salinisphaera dokdonensis]|uniref:hypothetical protein n=1 Tax=Salinisphaera dokdonensis TaxID=454598 RepID=UPI0033408A04
MNTYNNAPRPWVNEALDDSQQAHSANERNVVNERQIRHRGVKNVDQIVRGVRHKKDGT